MRKIWPEAFQDGFGSVLVGTIIFCCQNSNQVNPHSKQSFARGLNYGWILLNSHASPQRFDAKSLSHVDAQLRTHLLHAKVPTSRPEKGRSTWGFIHVLKSRTYFQLVRLHSELNIIPSWTLSQTYSLHWELHVLSLKSSGQLAVSYMTSKSSWSIPRIHQVGWQSLIFFKNLLRQDRLPHSEAYTSWPVKVLHCLQAWNKGTYEYSGELLDIPWNCISPRFC